MKTLLTVSLILGFASLAQAQKDHPCEKIHQACEAAGFKKGDHKDKKGLFKDCIQPILAGQSVAGVTVDPAEVAACKAKKEERREKKAVEKKQ